jgi:glycopeptide antibiotics resistance protein
MKFNKKNYHFLLRLLFVVYCVVAIWILFFQVGATERATYFTSRKIHYVPFESTFSSIKLALTNNFGPPHKVHYRYITVRNIVGNVFLFVPWGFLAPQLFSSIQTLIKILVAAVFISLCIEIIQFVLVVGVADIDDVLLNTVGAWIGFYFFTLLEQSAKM